MTFTQKVKEELARAGVGSKCCAVSEAMGMLLYSTVFSTKRIRIQSEIPSVLKRFCQLMKQAFDINTPEYRDNIIEITQEDIIKKIYDSFGYEYKNLPLQLNRAVIEEDCCKNSFLRGAFLIGGYATVSTRGYHLELVTPHYSVSRQVFSLLSEIEIPAGSVIRRGNYVLYYKNSELIEDFLSAAGAKSSSMDLMLTKVERNFRSSINRRVNCETANLDKTVNAAARHAMAIEKLKSHGVFDTLPQHMKDTAEIRLQYPELSLSELAEKFVPPVSKPGLNNRLRKLINMADKL